MKQQRIVLLRRHKLFKGTTNEQIRWLAGAEALRVMIVVFGD